MHLQELKIGIVGSGNVAHHLALAISQHPNLHLQAIHSRNEKTGNELATNCACAFERSLQKFTNSCNLIILCVADDAIQKLVEQINIQEQILVHTSGFVSIQILNKHTQNFGSFYPLQTFTKNRTVDIEKVPFLILGNNHSTQNLLVELAQSLSQKVEIISDEQRRKLHIAAVMVNNFTNHLWALAHQYTKSLELNFDLLKPLLEETAQKALLFNPKDIQTGPAKRKDLKTIQQHLAMLEDERLKELYTWFTKSIQKEYE